MGDKESRSDAGNTLEDRLVEFTSKRMRREKLTDGEVKLLSKHNVTLKPSAMSGAEAKAKLLRELGLNELLSELERP